MKLVKLEAHGFKSFADPIVLRFDGGVAGIVGPNGSGKSNINDAIRWVLGEQSSKELRGDTMEDVIFAGSKTVQPMNKAQVSLTFDNKDRISSIDADFITISRVLERGKGINDYFINGEKARHKDIKALAMETGIGKSSLAIISQGTVSDIAQSSDDDRRLIFEEAAGVSKYKFRKIEATRKLESADQTLKIVDTKINELEKRLSVLKKQAEKAYKYKQISDDLKNIEVGYLVYEIEKNTKIHNQLSEELAGVAETEIAYKNDIKSLSDQINEKTDKIKEITKIISQFSANKKVIEAHISSLEQTIMEAKARRAVVAEGKGQFDEKERMNALISTVNSLGIDLKTFEENYQNSLKEKDELDNEINELRKKINNINIEINNHLEQERNIKFNLNQLKRIRDSKTNLFKGTKTILDNKNNFRGIKGIVADLIKTSQEYLPALETILKGAAQHIVVDHSDTAVKAINFLKSNDGGRATFIPLSTIKSKFVRDDYLLVIRNNPGFVGIASELVTVAEEYRVLNEFLLGNVIVVSDIKTANEISTIMDKKYMVVTLDGDIIRVGGIMVGGTKEASENILGLDDKIRENEEFLPGLSAMIEKLKSNVSKENQELMLKEQRQKNKEVVIKTLSSKIFDIKSQINKHKTDIDFSNNALDMTDDLTKLNETEKTISQKRSELAILDFDLTTAIEQKDSLDADIQVLNKKNNEQNGMLSQLLSSFTNKTNANEKAKASLAVDKERLTSYYGLTLENAKANYPLTISPEAAAENVKNLRLEISELGNVNLESIQEYEEVDARYQNDVKNRDEVIEAKNICLAAIAEMDKKIVTRLTNIVNDVNREIHKVFSSMFGGGTAKVEFIDPKNILESGISIYAQPPGKTVKNLKLFSGGEKSLIAISLLFAILRARPLPLCILDEVEAALDEANVIRYAEYLQELKQQTQFLVITHRTGTMTRVDALFGATMQKRGVTNFFSVELEEAKKLVDQD
ncbi:AAA family ATPase [Mycoplasmopsis cynos]|uniref:Chromosome partition protein Smc n=1 Tax=Mycoplasmopsis cynos (strain C142) TaxID=1246955 RepID=L0RV81_MYCC1|nr:AAA family ATPase [Mycoplasmopsis cynos]WQQ13026.1 AAA family ATPase [Mycoplasmopsis cynos]WQQ14128.1 AAA family ATPase [Mycoplasmopsis cynos]WQQ14671.1 AAA family ATPase [Mycoplasmopsis cynos]WQQ19420.1 AAA family ATPase [Mycoplasmopsis cynos]CCP24524.1 Chromosome segregation protein SMC [Mycoplasmopsis cynos C142]